MLVYFLQSKGFIKGHSTHADYHTFKTGSLPVVNAAGSLLQQFLAALFFEGFAKTEDDRSATAKNLVVGSVS